MKRVLVTGGCGYVGSVLVPRLIEQDLDVLVVDKQWFGNFLPSNQSRLKVYRKGVDEIDDKDLSDVSCVIHLANIANDPGVELNPILSWEINALHLSQLLFNCKSAGVKRFIYASSGSVYGVKDDPQVTEDLVPEPISVYNKTKLVAERVVNGFKDYMDIYNIRPATVCGYSPRMRLDVVVNMFVWQAFSSGKIRVFGGDQIRPNININDMASVYLHFLSKEGIASGDYNAGFENLSVREIAELVINKLGGIIEYLPSNDPRSYRQDSTKLIKTGFYPLSGVQNAIEDLLERFQSGSLKDDPRWHTVKSMKSLNL